MNSIVSGISVQKENQISFGPMAFIEKSEKRGLRPTILLVFDFYCCKNFLERSNEKFPDLMKRRDLAIYLTSWLS